MVSIHNRGGAVDTLVNFSENELDMGTEFDCFENERNTITTIF
jgi:D-alanyl-D-alanine dipeptidase